MLIKKYDKKIKLNLNKVLPAQFKRFFKSIDIKKGSRTKR
jgi:hypothetical protein